MIIEREKNYVFDEFRLEPDKRLLTRTNGVSEQVRLANRPFQVLLYLIERRERFVRRDELLEKFWNGRDVYDTALTKAVGAVRKALNELPENPRFIETRWAEGYRFIGDVEEQAAHLEIERTRVVKVVIEEESETVENQESKFERRNENSAADLNDEIPAASLKSDSEISNLQLPNEAKISNQTFRAARQTAFALTRSRVAAVAFAVLALILVYGLTRTPSQADSTSPVRSVAVLPFKNLSQTANGEIFADGLTESLIASLSKIEHLKVVSPNSIAAFQDKDADVREIPSKLHVETFLEGGVRESANQVRVQIRLLNAETGEVLWTNESDERAAGDVLQIEDDLARSVAAQLRLKMTEADRQLLTKRETASVEAYQAYVKGRYFWKKKDAENFEKAGKFFDEAVALDPHYAAAYAGLAWCDLSGIWYANLPPGEALKRAKESAAKALELDDNSAEAHNLRARIAEGEWDWTTARREIEKSIELNPNEAGYWQGYAFALRNYDRRFDDAVEAMQRAQELDPLSPSVNTDVGVMLTYAGRLDEAMAAFKKNIELDARFSDAYYNLAVACERKGMPREAMENYLTGWRLQGEREERLAALREAFERTGIEGFRRKHLEFERADATGENPNAPHVALFVVAADLARLGETDAALEFLEKSYAAREPNFINLKSDFAFDNLRSDARFQDLLRRVGFGNYFAITVGDEK